MLLTSRTNAVFLLFMLCFVSCSPSINQLKQYEFAKELKGSVLQIPLIDSSDDIALLERYEQDKKAGRLASRSKETNQIRRDAFESEYFFSKTEFVLEPNIDKSLPYVSFIEIEKEQRENGNQGKYLVIEIRKDEELKAEQMVTGTFTKNRSLYAVRLLQKKLDKLYSEAKN